MSTYMRQTSRSIYHNLGIGLNTGTFLVRAAAIALAMSFMRRFQFTEAVQEKAQPTSVCNISEFHVAVYSRLSLTLREIAVNLRRGAFVAEAALTCGL